MVQLYKNFAQKNNANYKRLTNWNGTTLGCPTSVGTNGRPSYYGTFDQSGNLTEWNDSITISGTGRGRRGGDFEDPLATSLSSTGGRRTTMLEPSVSSSDLGFRIATLSNNNIANFLLVGNINNIVDFTGFGSVNYTYRIGKYEITNTEYVDFLNSVAKTDTYNLYNVDMGLFNTGGINRTGSSGSYLYSVKTNMGDKPVNYITWFMAARYCNWLHNNKPVANQNSSSTEDGAYTLNGANTTEIITKNNNATYWIPTEDEWYKAAYYDPTLNAGSGGYWLYATQSNDDPTAIIADSLGNGSSIKGKINFLITKSLFTNDTEGWSAQPTGLVSISMDNGILVTGDLSGDWQWIKAPDKFVSKSISYESYFTFKLRVIPNIQYPIIQLPVYVGITSDKNNPNSMNTLVCSLGLPTSNWVDYRVDFSTVSPWKKGGNIIDPAAANTLATQQEITNIINNIQDIYISCDFTGGVTAVADGANFDRIVLYNRI